MDDRSSCSASRHSAVSAPAKAFNFRRSQTVYRLIVATVAYDASGNITAKTDAGNFEYGVSGKPYAVSRQTGNRGSVPPRDRDISRNGLQRPATITENGRGATYFSQSERSAGFTRDRTENSIVAYNWDEPYDSEHNMRILNDRLKTGWYDWVLGPNIIINSVINIFYLNKDQ